LSGGFGYEIYFGEQDRHSLIPMVGYSLHYQGLHMTDGNQILWDGTYAQMYDPSLPATVPLGPFPGLDSNYDAKWWGPWLGLDMLLDFNKRGSAFARFEYHFVNYFGQANWNLRDDFAHPVSFEHDSNGTGMVVEIGWRQVMLTDAWTWGVSAGLQSWSTDPGRDRVYGAACGGCFTDTRLNEVNWTTKSISLTLNRKIN